jgi:DNA repair photolyase
MAVQREILAKSILTESGISDYSVNCYSGCLHNFVYCYARYMRKFTNHSEQWGHYLDVKINAPELLQCEAKRAKPGSVFFSSVCDPWQPAEEKYELTRRCLRIVAEAGFKISTLTKSSLMTRDLDILSSAPGCSVGCTITTVDESVRRRIEIASSPVRDRLRALEMAREAGIGIWVFCGPLLPGITDTASSIEALFDRLAVLGPDSIMIDAVNFRTGVFNALMDMLRRHYPDLIHAYQSLYTHPEEYEVYVDKLRLTVAEAARSRWLEGRVTVCR